MTISGRKENTHRGHIAATRSAFEEVRHLLSQRVERFPNDERHEALRIRCDHLRAQLMSPNLPERARHFTQHDLPNNEQIAEIPSALRQEHLLDGVRVSSTNVEIRRPSLPDHLSADKRSPYYVNECFKFQVGIRVNGKERFDVHEYCISQGWVMVPARKTLDRQGNRLLIKVKGTVESFYRDL